MSTNSSSGSSVTGLAGSSRDCRLGLGEASTDLNEGLPCPGLRILGTAPGMGPLCKRPCLKPPGLPPTCIAPGICILGGDAESYCA